MGVVATYDEIKVGEVLESIWQLVGCKGEQTQKAYAKTLSLLKAKRFEDREVSQFLRHSTEAMVRVYDKRARGSGRNPGRKIEYRLPSIEVEHVQ